MKTYGFGFFGLDTVATAIFFISWTFCRHVCSIYRVENQEIVFLGEYFPQKDALLSFPFLIRAAILKRAGI